MRLTADARRQQILQVAAEIFARQGFDGTTTRQIANAAAVNEALLFRHFPSKEQLYWSVLEEKCLQRGGREKLEQLLASSSDDLEVFTTLAREYIRQNAQDGSLMRLLLFSALENHDLAERYFSTHVAELYEVLAGHIRRRIREGVFRPVEPLLAARSFVGMLVYHHMLEELFAGKDFRHYEPAQAARMYAETWLRGMRRSDAAEQNVAPSKRPAKARTRAASR